MPDEATEDPVRRELHAAPPFLDWNALYIVVAATLLVEIAVFAAITLIYR